MEDLLDVIAHLRSEEGCPWDRKQTLDSLKRYLVEETCELLEAVDRDEPAAHCDELGDVLLQVLLQARIRQEQGHFSFQEVAQHLHDKLIRRHPHVFGDAEANTPADVVRTWNAVKEQERGKAGGARKRLDDLPHMLPALLRAQRVQERAARQGFDWEADQQVLEKVEEELQEVRTAMAAGHTAEVAEELGDLLFALVNLCRCSTFDAESLLRQATTKFVRRFHAMEDLLPEGKAFHEHNLLEMDQLWEAVKACEREHIQQADDTPGKPEVCRNPVAENGRLPTD